MSLGQSSGSFTGSANRPGPDWLWGSLGLGFAASSAAFAAYMIVIGPPARDPHGADFGVFAKFDHRPRFAGMVTATPDPGLPGAGTATSDPPQAIDYVPTGAIAKGAPKPLGLAPASPLVEAIRTGRANPLVDFVLRDVFDGKALVEGRDRLALVRPGSMLEGAGEVLSIERQRDAWVVVTRGGVIGARPR